MKPATDRVVSVATTLEERCQAFNLVYRRYLDSGFIKQHSSGMLYSLLDLLPHTTCWVVKDCGVVVGTMSVVLNSPAGMPSGLSFESDLRAYGVDGRVIGEFSKLASDASHPNSSTIGIDLMSRMIAWCATQSVDDLVCVVHPKHARTWVNVFGWKTLGDVKGHGGVNNNPGVLLHLDLRALLSSNWNGMPERGRRSILEPSGMHQELSGLFRASGAELSVLLVQRPELLRSGLKTQQLALERHFPWAMQNIMILFGLHRMLESSLSWGASCQPHRDRLVVVPNQLIKGRKFSQISNQDWEPLLIPDRPLILLVGAVAFSAKLLTLIFEKAGYIVFFEDSLESAEKLIKETLFDIIIFNHLLVDDTTIVEQARKRDLAFGTHTLVFDLNHIFNSVRSTLKLVDDGQALDPKELTVRRLVTLLSYAISFSHKDAEYLEQDLISLDLTA